MGHHKEEMDSLHKEINDRAIPIPPNAPHMLNLPFENSELYGTGQSSVLDPSVLHRMESPLRAKIPEPPRSKPVHVPEIVRGPLFIKQSKFYNALDQLASMRELISAIQEEVYGLNENLRSDVQLIDHLEGLLSNMEQSNLNVRTLVVPK